MTGAEFESAFRNLVLTAARHSGNVSCMQSADRVRGRCSECTFCVRSRGLARCHYCEDCTECSDCSHCLRSTGCLACQHCIDSERCVGSAFLVRSIGCSGCTYCFGCVGLSKRDFCVLNERYDRSVYFELTARLARELRISLP